MPATIQKSTHRSRQPKLIRQAEEIELATVYLELNSRVQPTWGQPVEPDAYITDLEGHILVPDEADREVRVGTVSAHSVHLGEAYEYGVSWFDVLDARNADTRPHMSCSRVLPREKSANAEPSVTSRFRAGPLPKPSYANIARSWASRRFPTQMSSLCR